jgi:broad specificity phosphatase PhoE
MNPKQMVNLLNADFERQRQEAWRELHRRPDALPLPPEDEPIDVGTRLKAVVRGWLHRLPPKTVVQASRATRAADDEARAT